MARSLVPIDSCDANILYNHKVYFCTNVNKFNVHWAKRIPFTILNTGGEIGPWESIFWNDFRSSNSLMMTEIMYQKLFRSYYVHSGLEFWYKIPINPEASQWNLDNQNVCSVTVREWDSRFRTHYGSCEWRLFFQILLHSVIFEHCVKELKGLTTLAQHSETMYCHRIW